MKWQSWVDSTIEVRSCDLSCLLTSSVSYPRAATSVKFLPPRKARTVSTFPFSTRVMGDACHRPQELPSALTADTTTFGVHVRHGDDVVALYDLSRAALPNTTASGTRPKVMFDKVVNYLNDLLNSIQATVTAGPSPLIDSAFGTAPQAGPSRRKRAATVANTAAFGQPSVESGFTAGVAAPHSSSTS